ncbi:hypothetical protein C8Q74DRAFT_801022 [Fomes fomentarius]|nr:hypothetical protein C8Q74DRAFT_801022 [Fomes fomentarius]
MHFMTFPQSVPIVYYWHAGDQAHQYLPCTLCKGVIHVIEMHVGKGSTYFTVHDKPITSYQPVGAVPQHLIGCHLIFSCLPLQATTPPSITFHITASIITVSAGCPSHQTSVSSPLSSMCSLQSGTTSSHPATHTILVQSHAPVPLAYNIPHTSTIPSPNPSNLSMSMLSKEEAVPILKTHASTCPTTLQTFLRHLHPAGKHAFPTSFSHIPLPSSHSQRTTSFIPFSISDSQIPSNSIPVQHATTYGIPLPPPPPILQYAPYPHAEEWGTPHLLLDSPPKSCHKATIPTPQSPIMGCTSPGSPPNPPCPNPSTHTSTIASSVLPSQPAFPIPPTPKPAELYTPPAPSPILTGTSHQRPFKPEGLAHKMARGWIAVINTFLEHHNNRPNVEHSVIQNAFEGMTIALEEIEEQKNLISADIIMVSRPHIPFLPPENHGTLISPPIGDAAAHCGQAACRCAYKDTPCAPERASSGGARRLGAALCGSDLWDGRAGRQNGNRRMTRQRRVGLQLTHTSSLGSSSSSSSQR